MAQVIKHKRGKLESIAGSVTPVNGELVIASGSDLSVHQEGLLFVGVEGDVLTPSNKILTGSSDIDVTGGSFDHSIDGVPFYHTGDQKLQILGKGGNLDVTFTTNSLDLGGSGLVSSSTQIGVNDTTITLTGGTGINSLGDFTTNQSSTEAFVFSLDSSSLAGAGLTAATDGTGLDVSVTNSEVDAAAQISHTKLNLSGSGIISGSGGVGALVTDAAFDQTADSIVFFDGDNTLKRDSIDDFLTAIAGTNLSVSSGQLTANAGDITGVTAGSGITGGGDSGAVVVGLDSGSVAGDGLNAKTDGSGLELDLASNKGLEISSGELQIKLDGSTLALGSGGIKVADTSIANGQIAADAQIAHTKLNLSGSGVVSGSEQVVDILASLNSYTGSDGSVYGLDVGIDNNNVLQANADVADDDFLRINGSKVEGRTASEVKSDIGLGNVENTAISTFAGSSNITTVGTIGTGTWQGTAIDKAYLDDEVLNTSLNTFTASNANTSLNAYTASNVSANDTTITLTAGTGVNSLGDFTTNQSSAEEFVFSIDSSSLAGDGLSAATNGNGLNVSVRNGQVDAAAQIAHTKLNLSGSGIISGSGGVVAALDGNLGDINIGDSDDTITIPGNLTVSGTTTYVNSNQLNIGDNILELNYAGTAADAGLLVKDAVGGNTTSGSFLWDASEDHWIAGPLGSEARVIVEGSSAGTADTISKFSAAGTIVDSIITESGTTVTISNDLILNGLTADQIVVTNSSKQLVSSDDISDLTLTLDGGQF